MLLFKVEQVYTIKDQGLVLAPGVGSNTVTSGTKIKLILPSKFEFKTTVKGILFEDSHAILIGKEFQSEDIPIGTEVWLDK